MFILNVLIGFQVLFLVIKNLFSLEIFNRIRNFNLIYYNWFFPNCLKQINA